MIISLAGRRIDGPDAEEERFPLRHASRVAGDIRARFKDLGADTLVCSAACGADLIALREAKHHNIRRRIVLPLEIDRFRQTSVVDRPGDSTWDWGALFDELTRDARNAGDLVTLPPGGDDTAAYVAANERIISEALSLSRGHTGQKRVGTVNAQVTALIVWEGTSRGEDDLTAEFARRARDAGLPVEQVSTL